MSSACTESAVATASSPLMRRPVLDARRAVHGYELQDRSPAGETLAAVLAQRDALQLADRRLLFVQASPALLASPILELTAPEHLVLQVSTPPDDAPGEIERLQALLQGLQERGCRIALGRSALRHAYVGWLELASYVMIDAIEEDAARLPVLLKFLRTRTKARPVACGVDSQARFEHLLELGFPLFAGDWFARPSPVPAGTMRPSTAIVMRLLNLLHRDAEIHEIEALLKQDPSLAVNLLRVINNSGMGLPCEVTSLRHAIIMLGRKRLFRWATMLMTVSRASGSAPAVASAAMVRGRLMELLAADMLQPSDCDNAFVVGLFSLLDVMLDMPMPDALESMALPEDVADALLRGEGVLAPFLALTQACESGDDAAFAHAAEQLQLSNHQVNWAHLQALAWAEELAAGW